MFSVFLPEKCLHCNASISRSTKRPIGLLNRYICGDCFKLLNENERPSKEYIEGQLAIIAPHLAFEHCDSAHFFIPEEPIQSLIHNFKYSGMRRLARSLGESISDLMPGSIDVIVPVPLHRTRQAERGYNQAEMLAEGLARNSSAVVLRAVRRVRATPSQTHLNISERIENVRGAFGLTRSSSHYLKEKNILIVDDVMTTGSTIASIAETITVANPKSISVLTLAVAEKPEDK